MNSVSALLTLKKGRERSLLRFHPWIFSGAIQSIKGEPKEGDLVCVQSQEGKFLACGHFGPGSLAVKILTFEEQDIDENFWRERVEKAIELRKLVGLWNSDHTTAFRLINGEGDFLPGLIVDLYNDTAVLQYHSRGMINAENEIVSALLSLSAGKITTIISSSLREGPVDKSKDRVRILHSTNNAPNLTPVISESGLRFEVNLKTGQKTGFFLDQRDNRRLLKTYSSNRDVLNAFSYSGGFSVYAFAGAAKSVVSVDSSQEAIDLLNRNVALNFPAGEHTAQVADCFEYLRQIDGKFDLIVLDPPAFAKHTDAVDKAARGYQTINEHALSAIRSDGLLFTFSCSQVVNVDLFRKVLFSAAANVGRQIRILRQIGHAADHPVSIYHPEGEYLKGFLLHVT